jgi:phosphoglucosamine mutase
MGWSWERDPLPGDTKTWSVTLMQPVKFGTDGVRRTAGLFPIDIDGAQQIGLGVGRYLLGIKPKPAVIIGRDTRISGAMLASALSAALMACGIDVVDIGVLPTAGVAYLTHAKQLDLGIIISASHNPWTENGIKLVSASGFKLADADEEKVEAYINEGKPAPGDVHEFGCLLHPESWVEDYIQYLIAPFKGIDYSRLKVVVDCSNGASSAIAPRCFQLLGSQLTVLDAQPNGKNINNQCGSEYVREGKGKLIPTVLGSGAHLGVAFDGDADRAVFVDEKGRLVDGDHVIYILAKTFLAQGKLPGKTVVTTEMANSGLGKSLAELGIQTLYTKVGDKFVVNEMRANGYRVGGEQSGHILILDDDHTTGDGVYTALFLTSLLLQQGQFSLAAQADGLEKFPQVIASARVTQKIKLDQVDGFAAARDAVLAQMQGDATINVRYSGTEPLLRVMIQGSEGHALDEIANQAVQLCRLVQNASGDANGWLEVKDCATGLSLEVS